MLSGSSVQPNRAMLLTPLLLINLAGLGLGFGIIVSSLTTKYRDLTQLVSFGVQLLMYATHRDLPDFCGACAVPMADRSEIRWHRSSRPFATHTWERVQSVGAA